MTDLRTKIMAVLRERGWTCEYHEPVDALGECKQCDDSHGKTADTLIKKLGLRTDTAHAWNSYDRTNTVTGTRYITDWNSDGR